MKMIYFVVIILSSVIGMLAGFNSGTTTTEVSSDKFSTGKRINWLVYARYHYYDGMCWIRITNPLSIGELLYKDTSCDGKIDSVESTSKEKVAGKKVAITTTTFRSKSNEKEFREIDILEKAFSKERRKIMGALE